MNPIASYETIDVAYPYLLRGADNQQTDTGLVYKVPCSSQGLSPSLGQGIACGYFSLQNRSGSTVTCGVGGRIPNSLWLAGQWDDSESTAYTDDTVDAQDAGTTDFPLETTTNSDGFVIASRVPFNCISIDVGTASVDATDPARAVRYSNTAGTGWTNFSNMLYQDGAAAEMATGENLIIWNVPADWGKVASGGLAGIPEGYYAVNVRATTAPDTTAASADSLSVYRLYWVIEGLADNGLYEFYPGGPEFFMPHVDALVAMFSVSNNQNMFRALVRAR